MGNSTTIAVDLAKSVFEVAVSEVPGRVSARKRVNRAGLVSFFANRPPAVVLMEACGSAHHPEAGGKHQGERSPAGAAGQVDPGGPGAPGDPGDRSARVDGADPGRRRSQAVPERTKDIGVFRPCPEGVFEREQEATGLDHEAGKHLCEDPGHPRGPSRLGGCPPAQEPGPPASVGAGSGAATGTKSGRGCRGQQDHPDSLGRLGTGDPVRRSPGRAFGRDDHHDHRGLLRKRGRDFHAPAGEDADETLDGNHGPTVTRTSRYPSWLQEAAASIGSSCSDPIMARTAKAAPHRGRRYECRRDPVSVSVSHHRRQLTSRTVPPLTTGMELN